MLIKFYLYSIINVGEFRMKKFLKKLKNFIVKNKLLSVLIGLFILIFILLLVAIKMLVFPSYSVSKYGNRLDGIENVKLDDSRFNDVKSKFDAKEGFTVNKFRLSGRIVNIFISVGENIGFGDVKSECMRLVSSFTEDEVKFYDFQVFVTGSGDKYPMVGYKHRDSEGLSWNYEGEN